MVPSDLVASQLTETKQTLSMNLLKSAQATQFALATTMMEDFSKIQQDVVNRTIKPAPHPYAGQNIDLKK